ncbi:class A beta-lactamase [Azospirillum sp. TSO22-1]|uniref:class A beta-lactamase n=1 Tax=Azospirillum sp. TSO22-1 TaxID=716789 RepID=UPI000D612309|nr:class A beta-lactamase [Azospirillum sp. TSO22-1]PWC52900.1 beta-lactamase [Azospirillum sp. TSO22-1]
MILTRRGFSALVGALAAGGALARPGIALAAGKADKDLGGTLAALEKRIDARLGVAVLDTATGRSWGHRADERFPMCSTFKALACGAVLARVDEGKERLDRRVRYTAGDLVTYSPATKEGVGAGMTVAEICEAAMTLSDNTAANLILDSLGGPVALTAFVRSLGDAVTRLDRRETELNTAIPGDPRDTTTPAAMAGSLRALAVGDHLSASSREQFNAWMVATRTGDARLRAGLPKDWRIGDKTGTGDHGTANDVAVIWPPGRKPLVVSVYVTQTKASLDDRNAAIAEVGRLVRELVV